jgi:rare lipoprotein A (peptidoglycan hydrolase)
MTQSTGLRAALLAGATIVALAIALGISHRHHKASTLPPAAGTWYTALAAPYTPTSTTKTGACGVAIGPDTIGIAHPVLPCGVKVYVRFGSKEVLTQVVDRGHVVPGRNLDVTQGLAKLLGLQGTQQIQWRFAR